MKNKAKKSVLVVGGGSGLGKQLAIAFTDNGWNVTMVSRSHEQFTNSSLPCYPMPRNEEEVSKAVNHLTDDWTLVVLVSGGGFGKNKLFEELETLNDISWINFGLHYCFMKEFYKAKIKTTVVMFGSIAARENIASPSYTLAKKQLETFIRLFGRKIVESGIVILGISLGATFCDGNAMDRLKRNNEDAFDEFLTKRLPRKKFLSSSDIYNFLEYLANSDASAWAGSVLSMDGGESTHL